MQYIDIERTARLDKTIVPEEIGYLYALENSAHRFIVEGVKGGEKVDFDGTVTGRFMRADGSTVLVTECSIVDGKAVAILHKDCYNIPGRFRLTIFETVDGTSDFTSTAIYAARGTVLQTQSDPLIDSGDAVPDINQVIARMNDMKKAEDDANEAADAANAAAENALGNFAGAFDASTAYTVGTYVTHANGKLYRLTAAHAAGTTWANTKKTLVTIGGEVSGKASNGKAVFEAVYGRPIPFQETVNEYYLLGSNVTPGESVVDARTAGTGTHHILIVDGLIAGETFRITARDGTNARPWAMLDKNGVLQKQASGQSITNTDVTVTEACAGGRLIVQVSDDYFSNASVVRNMNVQSLSTDIATNTAALTEIDRRARREKGNIYLGTGVTVDITSAGSGSLAVSISGRLNFKLLGDNGGAKSWEGISTELTASQITITDNAAVITVPNYYWLVYDPTAQQLRLRSNNGSGNYGIQTDDIVLLYNAYAQPVSGILHEKWLDQQARSADTRLTAAESSIAALEGSTDVSDTLTAVAAKLNSEGPTDCFLFFTDPHLMEGSVTETRRKSWMDLMRGYYNQLPVDFAVCGGDWLGNSDVPQAAMEKLSKAYAAMHSRFSAFHMVLGNHDTNYQGISNEEKAKHDADPTYTPVKGTGKLDQQANNNVWYGGGKSYYTFETPNALYIVLDTGVENSNFSSSANHDYYKAEADWLVQALKANTKPQVVFLQHIVYSTWSSATESTVSAGFLKIAEAYNAATPAVPTTASIAGESGTVTYTFNAVPAGHVAMCLAGHSHHDGTTTLHSIPCVIRTSLRYEGKDATTQPVFDIVVVNYGTHKVNCIRVGARGGSLVDFAINA